MIPEDLVLRLSHADPGERLGAVRDLAKLEDADALACLVDALDDLSLPVRRAAHEGLRARTGLDLGCERSGWLEWWKERASIRCVRCGRKLFASRLYYLAKLELTSEPKEIYLTEADLKPRSADELARAAAELAKTDPAVAQDEVYVRLRYYLCTPCKLEFVRDARANGALDED